MAVETAYSEQTEIQRDITEMVRQFADEQIIPNAERYDHEDSFPEPIVEQMKELGLFGVTIPEEYGGMGLTRKAARMKDAGERSDLEAGMAKLLASETGKKLLQRHKI
jgi:alkylation response protein AidB-like acyl-CoA dehydrogenase